MGLVIAETKYGFLRGVRKQSYTVFRGVPYAKPPIGQLRWKAPEPLEPWDGIKEAKTFGNKSMQRRPPEGFFYEKEFFADEDFSPPISEDSLYLNVWTAAETTEDNLPVAVWIHGGAFAGGYSSEMEFDGAEYCKRGVILVSINYRLGAFGFLAHPWLSAEAHGASGNYGLLDQIAALRWVRENISAFGGNPEKITIFGQSAGAISVQSLINTPRIDGMIAGAIFQSGGGRNSGINLDITLSEMEKVGEDFVKRSHKTSLEELRGMAADEIIEVMCSMPTEGVNSGKLNFAPCIDGCVLKQGYEESAANGVHPNIPYLAGSTKNDIGSTPELLAEGKTGAMQQACIEWSYTNEALGRPPAYVYYFARELLGDNAGAFHSSELWYMFGTLYRSWRPKTAADYALSKLMLDYWCNFIKSGNPNGDGLPRWNPCKKDSPFVMTFDVNM